jgi:hypothetical protein
MNLADRGGVAVRVVQFAVFLGAGLALGYFSWMSMMWGVWGAPIHVVHYLGVFGALGLLGGALVCLANPRRGRIMAVVSLAVMGTFWIPSTASLVPQHNVILSPLAFVVVGLYLGTVAFSLLYPAPWRGSVPALVIVLLGATGFAATTAIQRMRMGEFARPSIAYFRWQPSNQGNVEVVRDPDGWIDSEVRTLLERGGIHGRLEWSGATGGQGDSHHLIIVAAAAPPEPHELPYPREGVILYIFDGTQWRSLPEGAAVYPATATLEPQGSNTFLWQRVGGGRHGTTAFIWTP